MAKSVYSIKIGGMAGQGIKSVGLMLAKVASRSGYHIYTYTEYPSLIRGGHNVMQVLFSSEEVLAPVKTVDLLIALNQDTIDKHSAELNPNAGVIYDSDKEIDTSKIKKEVNLFPIPLSEEAGNQELLSNVVAIGAVLGLLGGDLNILDDLIKQEFSDKSKEVIDMNLKAAKAGFSYAVKHYTDKLQKTLEPNKDIKETEMIVNGNEAVALGAIAGGVQFASIYPMSPVSNILHVLAAYQEKYGFIVKQVEDEISAVNMATGASFTGARAMTSTSGGGFCLMTEGLGLAAITETPLVIVNGMRPGPATGLPTWSAQGDLQFALHAHQGDFPRIVLAAGDSQEAFELTMQAFNLADKYQTPVILLIDKNLCENDQSFPVFDIKKYQINRGKFTTKPEENYKRYALTDDGVSLRAVPGSGNFFIANSDEHTEESFDTEEIKDTIEQQEKRMRKLTTCEKEDMPSPTLFGPENADVTIVSWGSNKGSILTVLQDFPNVNYLHTTWMSPFPTEQVKAVLSKAKYLLDIECNITAQFAQLVAEKTGIIILDKLLKYDGRPLYPEEIREKLSEILKK
jgi:2-oxoglutarate ferredoxin oxidoreductase subunit alpha